MNWLKRIAQSYLHDEPDHDYDISWEHEVDDEVSEEIRRSVIQFQEELNANLLPRLGIFRSFKVEFVNSLYHKAIATYIRGTYTSPVVAIDIGNTEVACSKYADSCIQAVKTSILHELAHAIQESKGLEFDEDEAEKFAVDYYYYGKILEI